MPDPTPSRRLLGARVLLDPLVEELLAAPVGGVLATFDERAIHAVPMWFARDGEAVLLATGSRSRKVRNLLRDARATLVVHDSRPGFEVCGVSIAGAVTIVRGGAARPLVERVHRRYIAAQGENDVAVREFLASDESRFASGQSLR